MSNLIKANYILSEKKTVTPVGPKHTYSATSTHSQLNGESDQNGEHRQQQEVEDHVADLQQQKERLTQQIEQLQAQWNDLRSQMEQEENSTRKKIDMWWEDQEKKLKQVKEKAQEEGYKEGFRTGTEKAAHEYDQQLSHVQNILTQAYEEKEKIIQEAEPFLLHLASEMARKIVGTELKTDAQQLRSMIQNGMTKVQEQGSIEIHVSLEWYERVQGMVDELKQMLGPNQQLKVIPDRTEDDAGCMIHTQYSSYDVRLDSQLQSIKECLLQAVEERNKGHDA